jgi:hypothetical protein
MLYRRQQAEHPAENNEDQPDPYGHLVLTWGGGRENSQKYPETLDDETEGHQSQAGSAPGQERSFGGE